MGIAEWMRVLEGVRHLANISGQFRRPHPGGAQPSAAGAQPGGPGQLETRLAGVLVAALNEAFDRDRARIDLERAALDAERRRAEEALRAELRRQELDRAQGRVRLVATAALAVWMLFAALAVWLPGMHTGAPKWLLGSGWVLVLVSLASAFSSWRSLSAASASDGIPAGAGIAELVALWSLLGAIALSGTALLTAL